MQLFKKVITDNAEEVTEILTKSAHRGSTFYVSSKTHIVSLSGLALGRFGLSCLFCPFLLISIFSSRFVWLSYLTVTPLALLLLYLTRPDFTTDVYRHGIQILFLTQKNLSGLLY